MKCPFCGRELSEGDRFCPYCAKPVTPQENGQPGGTPSGQDPYSGYAVPPTPPAPSGNPRPRRGAMIAKAVLAVLLYLALFFGVQSCVIGTYIGTNLDAAGLALALVLGVAVITPVGHSDVFIDGACI